MIRRVLAIILIMAAACAAVSAEDYFKPHVSVGVRGGMSMASMSFSPSVKQSWLMGGCGAVTFRYAEERLFGFIVELGMVNRGWKENFEEHPFSYQRSLTYLTLPFMTHIYFGSKRVKGFINAGPSVSYMIGSSISANFDYTRPAAVEGFPRNRRTEQLWFDVANKFDYGICAGLGMELYINPRNSIVAEARLYYGLGNIFPASKADTFGASRNMNIEITAGYNFRVR